jgi:RNA polymerase sigma factor (TIGR02999 family)
MTAESDPSVLTSVLRRVSDNQEGAIEELADLVYADLHAMAEAHMRREFGAHAAGVTLQPTALANDTLMKLIKQRQKFDNRGHFFAIATKMMLRVLMDYHRQRGAAKRGGSWVRVSLDPERDGGADEPDAEVPALVKALEKLEKQYARKADVVKYRFLWGLSVAETAEALGVGPATVDRDWRFAKAWLAKELAE